ncbi:MAG: DUF3696 domain-containing protein [Desulfobacteraceae bacterium]|nr:DUF3696 domain-containing protein [Desulfobacteraceae bacterium]
MIKSIEFDNFKCFETQRVDFGNITLLTGLNSMGKSSVFQGILLLRQSVQQGMLPGKGLLLNGSLLSLGTAKAVLCEWAEKDEIGFTVKTAINHYKWHFHYGKHENDILTVADEPNSIPELPFFKNNFHYLSAERIGPRSFYEMSSYEVDQKQIGANGNYTAAYLDAYGRKETIPHLRHNEAVNNELVSQVTAWLGEISPGVSMSFEPLSQINRIVLKMGFLSDSVKSSDYDVVNVGFGLTYTLPVLVAVLSSEPGMLIMVENPEAHLHPKGQVMMGELFARAAAAGVQVIVETHSDHVLNGVRVAVKKQLLNPELVKIHFFDKKIQDDRFVHHIVSPQINNDGRLDTWPDGFFDQWEQCLDELLD